jgi:hypothetical protein
MYVQFMQAGIPIQEGLVRWHKQVKRRERRFLSNSHIFLTRKSRLGLLLCRITTGITITADNYIVDFNVAVRIRIILKGRIRIRINLQMSSQNVWNMTLFEHFSQDFEPLFGGQDPDLHQSERWDPDPDPHRSDKQDPDPLRVMRSRNTGYFAILNGYGNSGILVFQLALPA